jgi:hypothetical protein
MGYYIVPIITYIVSITSIIVVWNQTFFLGELLEIGLKEQEEMDKCWRGGAKCSHEENT